MATTSSAAVRRGHSFDGGGPRGTQGIEKKGSECYWNRMENGADGDDDEDGKPFSTARSGRKSDGSSGAASGPISKGGSGGSGGSYGTGSRGDGVVSVRKETGSVVGEKKRGLGEPLKVSVSSGGCGSPTKKKVKVSLEGMVEGKMKSLDHEDDEDDVPLATRLLSSIDVPLPVKSSSGEDSIASIVAIAKKVKAEKHSKTKEGLPGMANLTSNGAAAPSKPSTPRSATKEGLVTITRPASKIFQGKTTNTGFVVKDEMAGERKLTIKQSVKSGAERSVGLAQLTGNGAGTSSKGNISRPASKEGQATTPRSTAREVQGRIPSHASVVKDETPVELKGTLKPVVKLRTGNTVAASDDSDDDKPLSYRKSINVHSLKESKPDMKELKETGVKRAAGPNVLNSNAPAVKKIKMLSGLNQAHRSSSGPSQIPRGMSLQSPKSASLQSSKAGPLLSPKSGNKRDLDSTFKSVGEIKADLDDDDDDLPLAQRKTSLVSGLKTVASNKKSPAPIRDLDDDAEDLLPLANRQALATVLKPKVVPLVKKPSAIARKSITKKVLEQRRKGKSTLKITKEVIKKKVGKNDSKMIDSGGTRKWDTLEHNGVIFPPPYVPHGIKMLYKGKPVTLSPEQEEVATMFAVMKDTDYATKPKFIENFWGDWQQILGSKHVIQDFDLCDFTPIYDWHMAEKEKKKTMTGEEKKRLREEKLKAEDKYMWALVNGVKEKVGNFRVEPPGLFRGRGEHPKMGKLKKRIFPENIVINIGKGAPIPECPMTGHNWKEIRYDNTVTWLAYWNDPINVKEFKYVFLAASSSLKGQSDMEKYEKARLLKDHIENIRKTYTKNFGNSDPGKRQIAVATYLIDRLALRAGNEKDEDEADTVGCCSLKVEHVILVPPKSLTFDFLGKDSIRYFNTVEVEEKVYKAIGDFKKGKVIGNDLFDKLDTSKLNSHLKGIMPALTAKVFRTYNASITLDNLLQDTVGSNALEKSADYQRANKEVAILCNHQRTVSKSHSSQMEKLEAKMAEAEDLIQELKIDLDRAKKKKSPLKDPDGKPKKNQSPEALEKKILQTEQKVEKMKMEMRIKDDLKTVALGTSKINYLDPRITVAWCKIHEVPIEKIFNKSLLAKFAWAMDVDPNYRF